jgi:hypothetical protein
MLFRDDRLSFAWWNTGLSPTGKTRATEADFAKANRIIDLLLGLFRVDCLGLGEVTQEILYRLYKETSRRNLAVYDGTLRQGRLQFDTGAIYNTERLLMINQWPIIEFSGNRSMKLANRLDFVLDATQPLHLFISHWPSHLQPDSEELRITLAGRLRQKVDELMPPDKDPARVIIMGDFNEEPFHSCMEEQLLATRDRSLVQRYPAYLYNPFWRHLGESEPYTCTNRDPSFAGTCFVKNGHTTKWKTVDQIIVSSAFLGGSDWHLNENLTMFLPLTPKAELGTTHAGIFDHFPVIAVLEREPHDEGKAYD